MELAEITAPAAKYAAIKPGYRVGDDGTVWSCVTRGRNTRPTDTWRQLKPTPQSRGHLTLWLGRGDQRFVHRMVLEAFVGPCPEGLECRHLDGDPGNNNLDNLAWGTRKENHEDSVQHGTAHFVAGKAGPRGEAHPAAKLTEDIVREILALTRANPNWGPVLILRALEMDPRMRGAVDGVLRGQSWNHVSGLPPYQPKTKPGDVSAA